MEQIFILSNKNTTLIRNKRLFRLSVRPCLVTVSPNVRAHASLNVLTACSTVVPFRDHPQRKHFACSNDKDEGRLNLDHCLVASGVSNDKSAQHADPMTCLFSSSCFVSFCIRRICRRQEWSVRIWCISDYAGKSAKVTYVIPWRG